MKLRPTASAAALALWLVGVPASAHDGGDHGEVPDGFDHAYVRYVQGPTDLEWLPGGNLLVSEKNGKLWVLEGAADGSAGDPGSVTATLAVDLDDAFEICSNGERGLAGVAAHPDFEENRFVYLFFAVKKFGTCLEDENVGPVNRVSRFRLRPDNTLDVGSELLLFDTPAFYKDHHNSGDMFFGRDGNLWVTVGDAGTQQVLENPRDPSTPLAQALDNLLGKIVRVADDGGIPPDNPNVGPDGVRCRDTGKVPDDAPPTAKCLEVFASGLRNPFRFAMDPNTSRDAVRFFVNDVGGATWEETSEGGLHMPLADYGWPVREGPCPHKETAGCYPPPPRYADPVHWTMHGPDGGARTGGAFVPDGIGWPPEYEGAYMYSDYVFGRIYRLNYGGEGHGCRSCEPPTSDYIRTHFTLSEFRDKVTSIQFGPWGNEGERAMYYVTRGWGDDDIDGLFRISYTADANRNPTADIDAGPTSGSMPLAVSFDGTGSTDPDGDPLSYEWDFDYDGTIDSTQSQVSFTYTTAGTFTAKLVVRDGRGGSGTATKRIDVDNTPPLPIILTPPEGTTFAVGDLLTLTGSATDPEDGDLPDDALEWEVRQHHNTHYHPFLRPTTGNGIPVQEAPSPEDFYSTLNSYLEVRLTATDSDGLKTTVSRNVMPRTVSLSFDCAPPLSGLDVLLDGETIATPADVVSWEGHPLQVQAPTTQVGPNGSTYSWVSWSDSGARSRVLVVPPSPLSLVATYEVSESPSELIFSPTDDAVISPIKSEPSALKDFLFVDLDNDWQTLLRFDVSGVGADQVTLAKLRLFATRKRSVSGGTFTAVRDGNWDEDTVNAVTAPEGDIALDSLGPIEPGRWYEIDATPAVTGDGSVTFRISSESRSRALYRSKENLDGGAPQLVLAIAPSPSTALKFAPSDDAAIRPGKSGPSGIVDFLFVDLDNDWQSLVRFNVAGISGRTVTSAVLRLRAVRKGSNDGGTFTAKRDVDWDEGTVNWGTAPEGDVPLGSLGPVDPDTWYEVDVTPAITGDGSVTFRITSNSSKRALYCSKEHISGNVPELKVILA